MREKKRMLIGKIGLDGHDNGMRIVAKWFADAGFEVISAPVAPATELEPGEGDPEDMPEFAPPDAELADFSDIPPEDR